MKCNFFKRGTSIRHATSPLACLFLAGVWTLLSCGSSRDMDSGASGSEALKRFETEFDPSQYNPELKTIVSESPTQGGEQAQFPIETSNPPPAELVQGFRVQLHASTSIDQTSQQKERAEEIFPAEWFYMVYDAPTYKLRGGNFLTRFEADRFLKELKEAGFRDSWIVPDRVVRNPGPRTTATPEEDQ